MRALVFTPATSDFRAPNLYLSYPPTNGKLAEPSEGLTNDVRSVVQAARLLGFGEHDIQILMAVGKLTPLGDPASNAPKWFAAVELVKLATDQEWLHKATKELSKYWRQKRNQRKVISPAPLSYA